ncbi:MAG: DUF115 domain-containing protein [Treponema sp.]|jgi:hypothetical protein|nr:DUF115 domain-containing protein [Treponema sp.]
MSDEHPCRIRAQRGFSVRFRGKTLLSTVDPVGQAERAAEAAPLRDSTLYLCPSPLFGYGLSRLLDRIEAGGLDSAILCVEADRELMNLSLEGDPDETGTLPALLRRPRLSMLGIAGAGPRPEETPEESAEQVCAFVRRHWGSRRFRRVEALRLSGAWQLYPELYAALAEALRAGIAADWSNAMTLVKLGRRYTRNLIRNLAFIPRCPSLAALSYGRDPILVLGAGPSLDPFLRVLANHSPQIIIDERNFRIVCVDTAVPSLKARGIRPDLVIALESQQWNLRDFIGARGWGVPLAMDLSALPATARVLGGPCYSFFTPWTRMALFKRLEAAGLLPEQFPPLGSVGLSAVAAALRLSAGPMIVCGIDFSFTADSYHARSTPGHREKLRGQNRFRGILNPAAAFRGGAFAALSKSGQLVRSDPAMRNYRDLFEQEFAGEERLKDTEGSGLPLGIPSLSHEAAAAILWAGTGEGPGTGGEKPGIRAGTADYDKARRLTSFIQKELEALGRLRDILQGKCSAGPGELDSLLDFCDCLWAHFPECAAADRRPQTVDISFLKRVRTEIEPLMGLWELTLAACED